MLKPRAVGPGDRLAVVAPASPFTREEFDQGIDEIRRLGFVPVYDETVFARQRYVAGSPEVRAAAIQSAWRDPTIAGLIAASLIVSNLAGPRLQHQFKVLLHVLMG